MIRHITTKKAYEEILEDGFLRPSGSKTSCAPEEGYIAFETYNGNKDFYKALFLGKKSNDFNTEYRNLKKDD